MKMDMRALKKGLSLLESKTNAGIKAFAETGAIKMQAYAQSHAPWTDRTGDARKRLHGSAQNRGDVIRIQIAHGVEYGIWLELAHEKRFAIIPDTIRVVGQDEIMPAFDRLIERL